MDEQAYLAEMAKRHADTMGMMPGAVAVDEKALLRNMKVKEAGIPTPGKGLWKTMMAPRFGLAEMAEKIQYLPLKKIGASDAVEKAIMQRAVSRPPAIAMQQQMMRGTQGAAPAAMGGGIHFPKMKMPADLERNRALFQKMMQDGAFSGDRFNRF